MNDKRHIKLDDLEKKDIFATPDSYFDFLPSEIQEKIADTNNIQQNWFSANKLIPIGISISTIIIVILLIFQTNKPIAAESSLISMEDYLIEYEMIEESLLIDELAILEITDEEIYDDDAIEYMLEGDDFNEFIY